MTEIWENLIMHIKLFHNKIKTTDLIKRDLKNTLLLKYWDNMSIMLHYNDINKSQFTELTTQESDIIALSHKA